MTGCRRLSVEGALAIEPAVHRDHRGLFVSTVDAPAFEAGAGRPLFPVEQVSFTRSAAGVVRGVHYATEVSGSRASTVKLVSCARGRLLDIVVDLRVGSPTFGAWDVMELDAESFRSVYVPPGVGHATVALEDDTVASYLLSRAFDRRRERGVSVRDPALALPIPPEPILSDRDRDAPTIAEAEAAGALPRYIPETTQP